MKSVISLIVILSSLSVYAGSANAIFSCQSTSGRTELTASVPGDFAEHNIELSIDGEEVNWYDQINQSNYEVEKNSSVYVLGSLQDKNYHFLVTSNDAQELLTFTAIPSSIKVKQTQYGETGTLKAKINGIDPRNTSETIPEITLNCSYNYEI